MEVQLFILGHVILLAICVHAGLTQPSYGIDDSAGNFGGGIILFLILEVIYWLLHWVFVWSPLKEFVS
jgi:hypothetical protein